MRIATFNILHGRSPADDRVDPGRFADAVASLGADVLAMQEVDRDQERSGGTDLTAVAARAMDAPEHRFAATLHGAPGVWTAATGAGQPGRAEYGLAVLSRYPVLLWRRLALDPLPVRAPIWPPGARRPLLVEDEPRAALAAVVDGPQGRVTVVATHLTFLPGWNLLQLRRLRRAVARLPQPAVVVGDLNLPGALPALATGWTPLVTGATFPAHAPRRQIDHVLGTAGVRAARPGRAVATAVSDHRALVVDVALDGGGA